MANNNEIIKAFQSLFAADAVSKAEKFYEVRKKDKLRRKAEIARVSDALKTVNLIIRKYKYQIQNVHDAKQKKDIGLNLNQQLAERQKYIRQYSLAKQEQAFGKLDYEAQVYALTAVLFNKYFVPVIIADQRHFRSRDDFINSSLYQEIAHIRDYVSAYLREYPERISGARYFIGLHQNLKTVAELRQAADSFFEKLNSLSEKEINQIHKSHSGLRIVEVFDDKNLQAVQLLTKQALNYEGSAMHHCVGSYAEKVAKGESQIYSLRDCGDEEHELVPHATVEVKNGKIEQIKGPYDKDIDYPYVGTARALVMHLLNTDDFDDVIHSTHIKDSEKRHIGIYKDVNGNFHDILHPDIAVDTTFDMIGINDGILKFLPTDKIRAEKIIFEGKISQQNLYRLQRIASVSDLDFKNFSADFEELDLSMMPLKRFSIEGKKEAQDMALQRIVLPDEVEDIYCSGELSSVNMVRYGHQLKNFNISGTNSIAVLDLSQTQLKKLKIGSGDFLLERLILPINLERLDLKGNFSRLREIGGGDNLEFIDLVGKYNNLGKLNLSRMRNLGYGDFRAEGVNEVILPESVEELTLSSNNISISDLSHLQKINLKDDIDHIDFSQFYNVQEINISDINSELEILDLSRLKQLKYLFFSSDIYFQKLKKLILPTSLQSLLADCIRFEELEELDLSYLNFTNYGRISADWGIIQFDDTPTQSDIALQKIYRKPFLQGFSLQALSAPKLKRILFPKNIEEIDLMLILKSQAVLNQQMHDRHTDYMLDIDFSQYPNLRSVDLGGLLYSNKSLFSLTKCPNLTKLTRNGLKVSLDDENEALAPVISAVRARGTGRA